MREADNPKNYYASRVSQELSDRRTLDMFICASGENSAETILAAIGRRIDQEDKLWWDFSCKLIGFDNYEKDNYRKCLVYQLESYGHEVRYRQNETDESIN